MTLEPLLGSTALYRADVSWNTSSELRFARKRDLDVVEGESECDEGEEAQQRESPTQRYLRRETYSTVRWSDLDVVEGERECDEAEEARSVRSHT